MTVSRAREQAGLRAILAAVVVIDLLTFPFFIADARAAALARDGALAGLSATIAHPAVSWMIAAIGIAAAIMFGRRSGRLQSGMVTLAALATLSTVHAQLFGSPWRHLYFSGVCLLGWLLGLIVSARRGTPTDESYARVGSIALLAASYFNAGISKVIYGGNEWLWGVPLQSAMIAQNGLLADGVFSALAVWMVTTPAMTVLISVLTVAFELSGPLLLAGGWLRSCAALGLIAMHVNIYLLTTHILYWESIVLLLAFGLSSDRSMREDATAEVTNRSRPAYVAATVVLALCAFIAVGRQARNVRRPSVTNTAVVIPVVPAPPPTPGPTLARLGPLVVGERLADQWLVEALTVSESAMIATLSGPPGRVSFVMTCSASGHGSPFDVNALHISYSNSLPPNEIESAGHALQNLLRQTAGEHDICETVASWRQESSSRRLPGSR